MNTKNEIDEIEKLKQELKETQYKVDKYGLALMMIRAGTENPQKVAANALSSR